jgi:hypothetical protein
VRDESGKTVKLVRDGTHQIRFRATAGETYSLKSER